MLGIFGLGNPYRNDDNIGLWLIDQIRKIVGFKEIKLFKIEIDLFGIETIIEENQNLLRVLFIDAMQSDDYPIGTVLCFKSANVDMKGTLFATITHNIGIVEYIKLLEISKPELLPDDVTFLGIVVKDLTFGETLSIDVQKQLTDLINLIKTWTNGDNIIGIKNIFKE
ncbi:MAG: hydrogenase maturation protease [Candidatus Hodarchaeales archaeon]|jgi:hydrogenase maturation protease